LGNSKAGSQLGSQTPGIATDEKLQEVLHAWPRLAAPLKAAILALVRSVEGHAKSE